MMMNVMEREWRRGGEGSSVILIIISFNYDNYVCNKDVNCIKLCTQMIIQQKL